MTPLSATQKLVSMAAELRRHPSEIPYSFRWLKSMLPGHSPLGDEVPWVTFRAIDWLEKYLQPHMKVFEYGAGGSTLYFAKRAQLVVSVEHDKGFFDVVKSMLSQRGIGNCNLVLHEPVVCNDANLPFASGQQKYWGLCFEAYVKEIDKYPDGSFDVVLVDGRARVACVQRAMSKVKAGGALVLDNTDRPAYGPAYSIMAASTCTDFPGLTPWNLEVSQTTVWLTSA